MNFAWPWALAVLPLVAATTVLVVRRERRAASQQAGRAGREPAWYHTSRTTVPAVCFGLGLALIVVSLARPHASIALPRVESTLVLAFDNSTSMLATDVDPSRAEAARAAAHRIIDAQGSTVRIGVVAFSRGGVVLAQPTTDHGEVRRTVDRLSPDGGTSLGDGLFAALDAIVDGIAMTDEAISEGDLTLLDLGRRAGDVVVVFSDGENRAGLDPIEVARLAAKSQVVVFPVGIGTGEVTTVEVDGFRIATALDDTVLRQIADLTSGEYFAGADVVDEQIIDDALRSDLTVRSEPAEVTALVGGVGAMVTLAVSAWSLVRRGRVL